MNVNPSKAMFSIGLISISCVAALPIGAGASSYITSNMLMETYGITGYQFGMFTNILAKWPMLIAAVLYAIFVAPKMPRTRRLSTLATCRVVPWRSRSPWIPSVRCWSTGSSW